MSTTLHVPKMMSCRDVAAMACVSVETVRRWSKEGRLPAPQRMGLKLLFPAEAVLAKLREAQPA